MLMSRKRNIKKEMFQPTTECVDKMQTSHMRTRSSYNYIYLRIIIKGKRMLRHNHVENLVVVTQYVRLSVTVK